MRFTLLILVSTFCLGVSAQTEEVQMSDESLVKAAELLFKNGASTETVDETTVVSSPVENVKPLKQTEPVVAESEIPLEVVKKTETKSASSTLYRLAASLALLVLIAGGGLYATRKWRAKTNTKGGQVKIEMLHQYHLGPKRSLGLVRVAGEVLLIGITDHNINMMKTISLIDDEVQGIFGKNLNNFLEDEFSVEDVRNALRVEQ